MPCGILKAGGSRHGGNTARLTEAGFLALPDDGRKYEPVDGEAREVPTNYEYGWLGVRLSRLFWDADMDRYGDLFGSGLACRTPHGDIRAPDLSFVRAARVPRGAERRRPLVGAPDIAIEFSSPSETRRDMARKVREYLAAGAEQVWQVFPEARDVVVFSGPDECRTLRESDVLEAPGLLPGFPAALRRYSSEENAPW